MVKDYPQLAIRVPPDTRELLRALSKVTALPQWRVLSDAVDTYIRMHNIDERALVELLVERAETVLRRPGRTRRAAAGAVTVPPSRILHVDDNESMLFVRSRYLREEGFDVVEAQTGATALQLLDSSPPNLVLLDVRLPDANGLDICRRIKSDPKLLGVKVVQISSTFTSPREQLDGLETGGADIYLAEPVTRGTLLSVIRRLLVS
jgi:CheY-like chemotaxis protein